jgi:RNA polymerase sigma-70 factor (ECF subfamily)
VTGDVIALTDPATDVPALVEREAPGLLAYFARRVTPVDDAADLLGDTLVIVWRRRSAIPDDETGARMWLYGVARKVLSTHRRGASRRNALADKVRSEILIRDVAAATDPLHEHVRALIADLGPVDREIIGLHYWEGFSLAEVATIMSMRAATVRSRHARARARLRAALDESGDIRPA